MFDPRSPEIYDLIYEKSRRRSYGDEAAAVLRLAEQIRGRPVESLLDVACGTGGHLPHFAAHCEVEALDLNRAMVERARGRAPEVPVHVADMADFLLDRRFDAVVSLFSSIAYVRTEEGLRAAVRCMAEHLAADGVLILEPWFEPDTFLAGTVHSVVVDQPERKVARFNRSRLVDGRSVVEFHYLIAEPGGVEYFFEIHDMGLFSQRQMTDALAAAGLEAELLTEGLTGRGLWTARHRREGEEAADAAE